MKNSEKVADSNYYASFSSIRFFWATSVVLCHIYLNYRPFFDFGRYSSSLTHGGFAVTNFFVLSGFLICMKYHDRVNKLKKYDGLRFLIEHVKKWYLLYLITIVPFVLLSLVQYLYKSDYLSCVKLFITLTCHIFLLQSLFPTIATALNGVEWYLSCLSIIYLFVPILMYCNNFFKNRRVLFSILSLIPCTVLINMMSFQLYYHPIFRIFQFILGILIYNISDGFKKKKFGIIPCIFALLLQLFAYLSIFTVYTTLQDTIAAVVFIFIFANCKGSVSLLTGKRFMRLGSFSMELFLIHYPVVQIGVPILRRLFPINEEFIICEMIFLTIMSIALSWFYHYKISKLCIIRNANRYICNIIDRIILWIK